MSALTKFLILILFFGPISVINGASEDTALSLKQQKMTLALGLSLYEEKRYIQALRVLDDFIDIYPESPYLTGALEAMALIYEKTQRYIEALEIYRRLYQEAGMTTQGVKYYYSQGRLLYEMGEIQDAGKIFEEIVRLNPDSPYAKKAKIQLQLNEVFD
ncbi:MAG: tetratricopeptide repeat protein [Leptospirales bacterium]